MDDVADVGDPGARPRHPGASLQDGRAHLLRLRDQGEPRLEGDARGEWRQYEQTFPVLASSRVDQISVECANSRVPVSLLGLLKARNVLVGAVDVATDAIETPAQVAATIRSVLPFVPPERLFPCTNCGIGAAGPRTSRGASCGHSPPAPRSSGASSACARDILVHRRPPAGPQPRDGLRRRTSTSNDRAAAVLRRDRPGEEYESPGAHGDRADIVRFRRALRRLQRPAHGPQFMKQSVFGGASTHRPALPRHPVWTVQPRYHAVRDAVVRRVALEFSARQDRGYDQARGRR